jgi:NADH-quinone oxidoreductase subunit K
MNYIIILVSIELIIIGITILFINYSLVYNNIEGITTSIYLLLLAAAETAIGLTIILKL